MKRCSFRAGGRSLPRTVLLLFAVCVLVASAQALMVPRDQAELVGAADGIVLGTVTGIESRWTEDGTIETSARLRPDSTLKGAFAAGEIGIAVAGGTVDGITQVVEDEPVLAPGDRGFFLVDAADGAYHVHGAARGVIPVIDDRVWTLDVAGRTAPIAVEDYAARLSTLVRGEALSPVESAPAAVSGGPVIASVSPSSASAGSGATVTITGTGFGGKASRESKADVGFIYRCTSPSTFIPVFATGRPNVGTNVNDIVSWSDTRIVVRVPTGRMSDGYDGSASSGRIWVITDAGASSDPAPFTVTFGYGRIRWTSAPTFVVNNNCPNNPSAKDAVGRAATTWNAHVPASSFRLVNGGTTSSTATGKNGQNLVCWRPASDFKSADILAVTEWWFTGSQITECDVRFNSGFSWTTGTASGSTRSVEAIMLHEFGHWLNLRDLYGYFQGTPIDVGKVMFGYNSEGFGNLNRKTLSEGDVAGIRHIYGGVSAIPGGGTPRDLNGNGLYEDVNGNGNRDFADVILFFSQMAWIAQNEPVGAFDYNGNGAIDFADVIRLFEGL